MNILPKKNWHVRKKENIARVRRDEAEAAEQERKREQRQALAQQEARTDHLRAIAKSRRDDKFVTSSDSSSGDKPVHGESSQELVVSEHINFFREAELGQKDVRTNAEYEKEKRAEKEKAEKDIGLLTYLGQTTLDSKGTVPWYHKPSRPESSASGQKRPLTQEIDVRKKRSLDPMTQMSQYLDVKYQAEHEGHKRPREPPPSSSKPSAPKKPSASKTIAELRAERLERERKERKKQDQLLQKLYGPPEKEKKERSVEMDDRSRRYNSQFNPDLVKVKKKRYDYDEF